MIEDMYNLAENEYADIVICDFKMVSADRENYYKTVDWTDNKKESLQRYIAYAWTVIWNMLVKRKIYSQYKISFLEGYAYCEDFNLSVKLLLNASKVLHITKSYYNYRQNEASIMHNLNEKTMNDEQVMYMDVIDYLKEKNVYNDYAKQMCWRILKSKQEWVLNTATHDDFLQLHPESHKYIGSCPFIKNKLKIMMWSLTHHLPLITKLFLVLRFLKHGK